MIRPDNFYKEVSLNMLANFQLILLEDALKNKIFILICSFILSRPIQKGEKSLVWMQDLTTHWQISAWVSSQQGTDFDSLIFIIFARTYFVELLQTLLVKPRTTGIQSQSSCSFDKERVGFQIFSSLQLLWKITCNETNKKINKSLHTPPFTGSI